MLPLAWRQQLATSVVRVAGPHHVERQPEVLAVGHQLVSRYVDVDVFLVRHKIELP
jgi:hypothetical protein